MSPCFVDPAVGLWTCRSVLTIGHAQGNDPRFRIVLVTIPVAMSSIKKSNPKSNADRTVVASIEYDFRTPRWQEYYRRVRATVKFPRYYNKKDNW